LEESSNPFATVVLAHLDTQETRHDQGERKDRKFHLIKRLFERGWNEKQIRDLFRLIDWMMDLPEPLADRFWDQVSQLKEEKRMPFITTPERYGRADGLTEGIEVVLRIRFRDAVNELMAEIRRIRNWEKLEKILQAAETVASAEELRKLVAAISAQ
jgi:hypothetical protein